MKVGNVGRVDVAVTAKVVEKERRFGPRAKHRAKVRVEDHFGFETNGIAVALEALHVGFEFVDGLAFPNETLNVQQNACREI